MADEMDLLREQLELGFEDIHRRMDDTRDIQTERHNQNLAKMIRLDEDIRSVEVAVNAINGTVVGHTHDIKELFARGIPITLSNLRWYLSIAGVTAAVMIWILHTVGILK
jgi:hypothetical protein